MHRLTPYMAFFLLALQSFIADAQETDIPDSTFKACLLGNPEINTDGDSAISLAEAAHFHGALEVKNKGIESLTGIEYFVNLTGLNCSYNKLIAIDLSQNAQLVQLDCSRNDIDRLDVSANSLLTHLFVSFNQIHTLVLDTTAALIELDCSYNELHRIDLTPFDDLTRIEVAGNFLTRLDVRHLKHLNYLDCSHNQLSETLDVSQNVGLDYLNCKTNFHLKIVFVRSEITAEQRYQKDYGAYWFAKSSDGYDSEFKKELTTCIEKWNKSAKRASLKMALGDFFLFSSQGNYFLGLTQHLDMRNYALGGEFKGYFAPYELFIISRSLYVNYRRPLIDQAFSPPQNVFSIGGHFGIFGLEANAYADKTSRLFYLTPKIGLDNGHFSLFYGYSIALTSTDFKGTFGHNVAFKYFVDLGAFRWHRSRVSSSKINIDVNQL